MSVAGEVTTYTLDYANGLQILMEQGGAFADTKHYLYGVQCIGELVDADDPEKAEWRYYHRDGGQMVRQTTNEQAEITLAWAYTPEGMVLVGEKGPVTYLDCGNGAIYDWSTGLIFKNGGYFDPAIGIWLIISAVMAWQVWPPKRSEKRKQARQRMWLTLLTLSTVSFVNCQSSQQVDESAHDCPPGPYSPPTADNSWVVTVNIVHLHGATSNWKQHVDLADRIFDQADVSIRANLKPPISAEESERILGRDKELNADCMWRGDGAEDACRRALSIDECRLLSSATYDSHCAPDLSIRPPGSLPPTPPPFIPRFSDGRITMYYVPSIKSPGYQIILGKAYLEEYGHPSSFVVNASRQEAAVVWSHELGHVFGLEHVTNDPANLMTHPHNPRVRVPRLADWQHSIIQQRASRYHGK
jgi:hypothetical protein